MAYQINDTIRASDINALSASAGLIYGIGTGDRGYGQTAYSVPTLAAGNTILSSHMVGLRNQVVACATHQGTPLTDYPPQSVLAVGQTITAHESNAPSNNIYDIDSYIAAIDSNRLTAAPGGMSLPGESIVMTRSSVWSASITGQFDATFPSENAARHFFNSGGKILFRFAHSTLATPQDSDWVNAANKLGQISFGAHGTTSNGSSALASGLGFYEMNNSQQLIINGTSIGTGAYSANDVLIYAKRLNYAGVNGGNGNAIRFQIVLNDDHVSGGYDQVASGTLLYATHLRAVFLSGISAPVISSFQVW